MVGTPGPPAPAPPGSLSSTGKKKIQDNRAGHQRVGPTCGFTASPEVDPRASIGTLKTEYLRIQALSQDKE
jgi:hypothetical protein